MNCIHRFTRLIQSVQFKGIKLNTARYLNTQKLVVTSPLILQPSYSNNSWTWHQKDCVGLPIYYTNTITIKLPNSKIFPFIEQPVVDERIMECPSEVDSNISKHAARLIVIRRKKMKKHKLKKLRKRMKFEWAKLRQRRELKKEKAFQAVLIQQCKEAEAFSAEQYVTEKINKLNEITIPKTWKGRRLPEFLIRQKMGLPSKN